MESEAAGELLVGGLACLKLLVAGSVEGSLTVHRYAPAVRVVSHGQGV